jgi:hypothetical protein
MKKFIVSLSIALITIVAPLAPLANAAPPPRQFRIMLEQHTTVDPVEIVRHFSEKCSNVTITTNPKNTDFQLRAWGWSGDYRFMVVAHGGDTVFATRTAMLSNAVKDVCKFLNSQPDKGTPPPPSY